MTVTESMNKQITDIHEGLNPTTNAIQYPVSVITQRVKEFIFGVSKIEKIIFGENNCFYESPEPVYVCTWRDKKRAINIETLVSMDFKEEPTVTNENRLTPFDWEIHNAVATLRTCNNEYINPKMIYNVLSGKNKTDISDEARENISRSMNKMMSTHINIDASAEYKVGRNKFEKYEGPLIPAERIENVKLNGNEVKDCIHVSRNPPLFDYALGKNQVGKVDVKILNAPVNNTVKNIILKGYMLRAISSMKNPKSKLKHVLRYDTIYKYLNVNAPDTEALNQKHKEIRDKVKKFLDFWKSQNFVEDYREEKEGRVLVKVVISV